MKDFRNNLHPAFFNKEVAGESAQEKTPETVIKTETEEALTDLQANIAGGISSEMSSKYSDTEKLKSDRERFTSRIQAKNRNGVKYGQIWSEKIGKGFNDLCTILKKKGLLNEKNKQEIKDLYLKEVHSQYETYIWRAGNNTFNSVKDTIFGKDSKDYPVEKVYKQLTGAVSVSNVDRTNVEGYESEVIDWTGTKDGKNIDMNEGQNIDFLSDDLPQYLWGIRKTPGVLNVLKWLPIFSVKEDRPSKVDRKAIRHFLKISSKIKVEGNKDKALALMELFRDNSVNLDEGRDSYKIALAKHGIKAEEKDIDDIIKAGSFFINTQTDNLSTRDQHAIYLSVLKIIESEGGVKNAVNKFKSIVEQDKTDTKIEKKEGYKSGKLLQEKDSKLYGIAKNLGITDFTAATRLSEKTSEYFWNTPIEKILANLNNDRTIDVRDAMTGGSKSGAQFLEVFKQVGKEKALSNLLKRAKLMNKNLGIGLPDTAFNPKTLESAVKNENTGLILMLQNIISNPREDLYELLSGEVETIDAETLKAADKAATEMISKINKEELEKRGLRLPTPESMQSGLATALYTEYKRGVGLGGKISFDQWIKGVEMNTGFQVRDGGVVMVGIGLDYSKSISLGKGWSANPELSAGAFIPLGTGKIEEVPGSVGFNNEVAKRRITENGIQEHLGLSVGATLMPAGVIVLSAGFKWEQNKAQGIESAEYTKMLEFRDSIMSPILDDIYNTCKGIKTPGATKLNFNDENLSKVYKNSILKIAKKQNVPEKEQEKVVDGVIRALLKYDNYDLSNETTRKIIAQGISEQYAMAWAEDRKAHITDKTYLSGASLGTFRVVGSPLVGLYVGAKVANHNLDGYGDKWGRRIEIDNSKHEGAWDKKSIDDLNNSLGLSENEGIKITDKGLKLPKSLTNKVKVSRDMIGLMVKDTDGSILLSKWTSMGQKLKIGTASQSKELFIGEGKDGGYNNHLDAVGEDWFKKDMEGVDALVLEKGNDLLYTPEKIKEAIQKLKKESKGNLDDFNPTEEQINQLIQQLKRFEKKDKKVKIEVERKSDGTFVMNAKQTEEVGRGIEVEYVANLEMINGKAKEIARAAYTEALRIRKPSSLHSVKHKPWSEYTSFNEAMQSKSYETAKNELKSIFGKLDEQNSGANFTEIGKSLDEIDDINALAQALMSINNIFARSKQVRGGGENYEFKRPYGKSKEMRAIIKERYKILNTIESKIDDEKAKGRYKQLFDATSKYVNNPKNGYAIKSTKAASLSNTVGFNLGDKTNPENPLFNPEIYNPMVDLNSLDKQIFTDEAKNALHKRAMTLFANNEALINPIKKAFHIADNAKVNVDMNSFSVDGEKGKLTLDIGGKKVTLSAGMKFGFFTQCVNHTIILDDISAESDGNKIDFKSGTWKNDEYVPGNKRTILSTTEVGVSLSFIVRDGTKNEEKQDTTTEPEETVREKQDTTTDPLENTKDNNPGSNDNSQNTNTPPTAGEGDKGGGGGGGRK